MAKIKKILYTHVHIQDIIHVLLNLNTCALSNLWAQSHACGVTEEQLLLMVD